MGFYFVTKAKEWEPGKAKLCKVPKVQINTGFDDSVLIKLPGDKKATFSSLLSTMYAAKEKDALIMAGARMRGVLSTADAAIEKANKDPKAIEEAARKANSQLGEACRDIERALTSSGAACVMNAYKSAVPNGVPSGKVNFRVEVKVMGKIVGEGGDGGGDEGMGPEEITNVLTACVYPAQDDAEGVAADGKAANGALEKAIKEANVLSKAMREQAKKETAAGEKLITTTSASLHKNYELAHRLAEGSKSKLRQLKGRLGQVEQKTKELKNNVISAELRECTGRVDDLQELLTGLATIKPLMDGLKKEFDGKIPDFGKMTTAMHRAADPKLSTGLEEHLGKLGDALAKAAAG